MKIVIYKGVSSYFIEANALSLSRKLKIDMNLSYKYNTVDLDEFYFHVEPIVLLAEFQNEQDAVEFMLHYR